MTNLIDANENTYLVIKIHLNVIIRVFIPSVHINYPYLYGNNIIENYVDDSCDRHISHLRDIILRGNYEIFCTVIEDFEKDLLCGDCYTIMSEHFLNLMKYLINLLN